MKIIGEYVSLLRIKHWMKNVLIFLAIVFSSNLLNKNLIIINILGFFSFSFMSSAIYIFNDTMDINNDREHLIKKNRPLASSAISVSKAIILLIILIIISLCINVFLIKNNNGLIMILLYCVLNIMYSIKLKKIPLVDILILVSGFVIRTYYGAFITGVVISKWLYLTIMLGSFFMAFGKRRNEIINYNGKSREVLRYYNKEFLDKFMYVSLVLTIVFYSLWCIDLDTINRIGNDYLIYSIPLVYIIFMKYSLNIEGNCYGDPVDVITSDKILLTLILLLAILMIFIIYIF